MTSDLQLYIESHSDSEPQWLYDLNRRTNLRLLNGRMCSGPLQGRLLKMLTAMIKPHRVLELGTFSGYSALCIAEALIGNATIDTIEADDELEDFIRESFSLAPESISSRITLHIGAALDVIDRFDQESFDLAFIDASKREYPLYYKKVLPIIRKGGFIIADNTLWDSHVIDDAYDRDPQTRGVREFNDMVAADTNVEKVIIPVRDGLTIIRKL